MISRFGDYAQSQQITKLLLGAQSRSRETQTQLSSRKVADRFREIGSDTKRLLNGKTMLQKAERYQANNTLVQGRLEVMESSLASLSELGTRLRVLVIQRQNDGSGTPGVVAAEARLMLEQAVSNLNAEFNGRHLFAGTRTDRPPVALDPAFSNFGAPDDSYYQGDDVELSVLADDGLEVRYGMTADRAGFQELIGAFRAVIEGDGSNDEALLEQALGLVNDALPKLDNYRSELGARHNQLERVNTTHSEAAVFLERQISSIEDVDLAAAVTRLSQHQLAIEASMATISRLNQLTLTDFIR